MQKTIKILIGGIMLAAMLLCGCSADLGGTEEGRMIEYKVLGDDEVPDEFKSQIEDAKGKDMKLTYKDNEYLYIARGYGQKETGGYSISVVQMYAENKAIYFETKLIEPSENETVSNQQNFPDIVVKTELCDMPVVFK